MITLFKNKRFQKVLSGIPQECLMVWMQIRPDILSGSILSLLAEKRLVIVPEIMFMSNVKTIGSLHC